MKAAGRYIEAKKQQELRGKKGPKKGLSSKASVTSGSRPGSEPRARQQDRKGSNIPSGQREPLGFQGLFI